MMQAITEYFPGLFRYKDLITMDIRELHDWYTAALERRIEKRIDTLSNPQISFQPRDCIPRYNNLIQSLHSQRSALTRLDGELDIYEKNYKMYLEKNPGFVIGQKSKRLKKVN